MDKLKYSGLDEVVYYEKLNNGIDVYLCPSNTARNFYMTFNVKYGSLNTSFKYEGEKKYHTSPNGTAHFLEHQLFQEDDGHTAFEKFAELGSSVNAFTTYNLTCYEVIASDNFKENLETLLDYVQNPVFKPESVQREKGIIKEEINMYDNNPGAVLTYNTEYNLNVKDNHKYLISGEVEDIKKVTPEVLYEAYNAFYQPGNMFIVISGKFKPLEALGIIKKNQTAKEFSPYKKVVTKYEKEPEKVFKAYEERSMDIGVPKIKMAYKIKRSVLDEFTDLELRIYLDAILTIKFGTTSDFLERVSEENLITWDIITERAVRKDYVSISVVLESDYPEEIMDLVRRELHNLEISKEELERIKKANIANFILHFNDILSIVEDIQDDIINNGSIETDILNIYKKLNITDANKIAKKISLENETVFVINKIEG